MPPGTKDLRRYMQLTALPAMIAGPGAPPMPPRGHTTHRNNLSVRAEDWRRLESMLALNRHWVNNEVIKYEVTGDRITVPCPEYFSVPELILGRPSNLSQVCRWVIDYPLTTLQRVIHLSFPQTKAWSFSSIAPDVDEDLVACVTWDRITEEKTVQSAVAVMIQPPWIASLKDLERFVACSTLRRVDRNYEPDSPENTYKNKERMWAKVPEHVTDVNIGDDDEIPDEPYGRFPSPPASESSWSAASSGENYL
ncbi:hypothetical protein PHLCEN_2v9442 [Hermanssonia centrifuga]|uniref:Uncharacterized protein n=1 Tax=Hermanssonia centrifuga TaxID=98765 RepID=A0A2R6NQQ6_9APHY|nr:hypothetical protein PHLCEN_2v9442 [Hermanssonia centrifuga]